MAAEPVPKPGQGDDASDPPRLSEAEKDVLRERLKLSPEQEKALAALDEDQLERWYRIVQRWSAPEARLAAIDTEIKRRQQPVPAFHVPTAEGVATYRGLFGGNGSLTPEQKKHVQKLLRRAIGAPSDGGNGDGQAAEAGANDPPKPSR
jgi:hypothetical protein